MTSIQAIDCELIRQAEEHHALERYLAAAQKLKRVSDDSLLTPLHRRIIEIADNAASIKHELLQAHPEQEGWKKQTEKHGHRDVVIYYKIDKETNQIIVRIDSPIESSLLNPLLSVFNESDLYQQWMPRYKIPFKLGMSESNKLSEFGRGHQIVQVKIDMPPMFNNRECIQHACAVDSIEEDKSVVVTVNSMNTGKHFEMEIPPVEKGYTRVDLKAGILFRSCPDNHPALQKSKHKYPAGEPLILVSVMEQIDAHVAGVPLTMINFFTRTVLGAQWISLLKVAEEIRDGQRTEHLDAIQQKQELYSWVSRRVEEMFENSAKEDATANGEQVAA